MTHLKLSQNRHAEALAECVKINAAINAAVVREDDLLAQIAAAKGENAQARADAMLAGESAPTRKGAGSADKLEAELEEHRLAHSILAQRHGVACKAEEEKRLQLHRAELAAAADESVRLAGVAEELERQLRDAEDALAASRATETGTTNRIAQIEIEIGHGDLRALVGTPEEIETIFAGPTTAIDQHALRTVLKRWACFESERMEEKDKVLLRCTKGAIYYDRSNGKILGEDVLNAAFAASKRTDTPSPLIYSGVYGGFRFNLANRLANIAKANGMEQPAAAPAALPATVPSAAKPNPLQPKRLYYVPGARGEQDAIAVLPAEVTGGRYDYAKTDWELDGVRGGYVIAKGGASLHADRYAWEKHESGNYWIGTENAEMPAAV